MHLDRLISIMELVAVAGRPVLAADIQKATGLPKPTCYRLVQTLLDHGMIDSPAEDGRVVIGERLIRIALLGKSDVDVRKAAAPLLKEAAVKFNETVFLSRFRNHQVEIIHVETPDDPARAYIHPGLGVRPLHACSCSKAIAAFAEPEFQDSIITGTLRAYTEFTKTTEADLRHEFTEIVKRGFADCDQEIDIGIASVAAPVSIGNIGATFSVGAVGPIRRFGSTYRAEIGQNLIGLANRVSGAIQLCNVPEV
ncbi:MULTISPECIES: IclR family transcriptional regulator [Marivita]|jgi:DNA-binding IclR family transcriptional regulator|uniref:IclR family transcriptional regulator n=1 Tax=Marivita cryptomonadis TaxID=505252 RepID=A0A9Q2S0A6_9RHOB|nr:MULTISPECIES: IclR family transcriptional regulator [Marivita]MCR9169802.1 IclR family transcriptional regulator [Paracoccaceae bacterium]MBM2322262.1 IclR family transcriptional regulator [Marivita cryptomonadis]MBM2331844.1 IclR family transcriptional regulator [Marivita cryptomonadis]MBM2341428.1 IclR family transcriptional regulator [Marivita cryptomonadis]MBM2346092.1 IclR family transcriptional regulator [Marivita cryptomonadis]